MANLQSSIAMKNRAVKETSSAPPLQNPSGKSGGLQASIKLKNKAIVPSPGVERTNAAS